MPLKRFTHRAIPFAIAMLAISATSAAQTTARPEAVVAARRPPPEALTVKKFYTVKIGLFVIDVIGSCSRSASGVQCPLRASNQWEDERLRLQDMFAVVPDGTRIQSAGLVYDGTGAGIINRTVRGGSYLDFTAHFKGIDPTVQRIALNFDVLLEGTASWLGWKSKKTYTHHLAITDIPIR